MEVTATTLSQLISLESLLWCSEASNNLICICVGEKSLVSLNCVDLDGGADRWYTMTMLSMIFPLVSPILYGNGNDNGANENGN